MERVRTGQLFVARSVGDKQTMTVALLLVECCISIDKCLRRVERVWVGFGGRLSFIASAVGAKWRQGVSVQGSDSTQEGHASAQPAVADAAVQARTPPFFLDVLDR